MADESTAKVYFTEEESTAQVFLSVEKSMATAYFCNCIADRITVGLNNQLAPTLINPRAPDVGGDTNPLPMVAFPIMPASSEERESGTFKAGSSNTVVVNFETVRDSAIYEVTVEESVAGGNLYFYVFEHTLVGQDKLGRAAGISIQAHETVKKLIQSGTETSLI